MFAPPSAEATPRKPPGNRQFTPAELRQYNGTNSEEPVYLAIKGVVYDVTPARAMYTPPGGYSLFAGRDATRALAKSSLKEEDVTPDDTGLTEEETGTLNKWVEHYKKKYDIMGTVSRGELEAFAQTARGSHK
ncbi:hypothetical protein HK104_007663 [Borealophlyctis nickersoniae]|nr:hypothetical protein HK104_007663 [Borealophlyctis nickersoniae]